MNTSRRIGNVSCSSSGSGSVIGSYTCGSGSGGGSDCCGSGSRSARDCGSGSHCCGGVVAVGIVLVVVIVEPILWMFLKNLICWMEKAFDAKSLILFI